jgi:hypothetical protein
MRTHAKRARGRILWTRGRWRNVPRDRARDEDLNFFLKISRDSLRVTARDLDELIRPT